MFAGSKQQVNKYKRYLKIRELGRSGLANELDASKLEYFKSDAIIY